MPISGIEEKKTIRQKWYSTESILYNAMNQAAARSTKLSSSEKEKWILSVTDQEVCRMLQEKDCNKRMCCLSREIHQFSSGEEIDFRNKLIARFTDVKETLWDKDAGGNLQNLKQKVKNSGITVFDYKVNWTVSGITEESHMEYLQRMGKDLYSEVISQIKAEISVSPKLDDLSLEIAGHLKFCNHRAESFRGRRKLVSDGLRYLTQERNDSIFVVHGNSGSGKTSLMSFLVSKTVTLSSSDSAPIVVVRFCGISPQSSSVRPLLRSVCQQMKVACNTEVNIPDDFNGLSICFKEMLHMSSVETPIFLFIDSLDQLNDDDLGRSDLSWLPDTVSNNVKLVVSTLPDIGGCLNSLKQKVKIPDNFLPVEPLTQDDAENIMDSLMSLNKRKLQNLQISQLLQSALDSTEEEPNPLRLQLCCQIASDYTSYDRLPMLPITTEDLINNIFQTLEIRHGKLLVSRMFSLIAASKHGLSETDLVDMLSCDEEVMDSVLQYHQPPIRKLPQIVFSRLRHDLRSYVIEKGALNKTVLNWFHRQFSDCARERYFKSEEVKQSTYATLASFFSNEIQSEFKDRPLCSQPLYWISINNSTVLNLSHLVEFPHAVLKLKPNKQRKYYSKLFSLEYVSAKCKAGLGREVITEFNMIKKISDDDRINSYAQFVNQNMHLFEHFPKMVLQQALNSPERGPVCQDARFLQSIILSPLLRTSNLILEQINKPDKNPPCVMTLSEHQDVINDLTSIKFANETASVDDTAMLVSCSNDSSIKFWEITTGRLKHKIHLSTRALKLSTVTRESQNFIVCGCGNGRIYIYKVQSHPVAMSELFINWEAHESYCETFAMDLDTSSHFLLTGYTHVTDRRLAKGEVKLWNIADILTEKTKEPRAVLQECNPVKAKCMNERFGISYVKFLPGSDEFVAIGLGGKGTLKGLESPMFAICSVRSLQPLWSKPDVAFPSNWIDIRSATLNETSKTWCQFEGSVDLMKFWTVLITTESDVEMIGIYTFPDGNVVGRTLFVHKTFGGLTFSVHLTFDSIVIGNRENIEILKIPEISVTDPTEWDPKDTLLFGDYSASDFLHDKVLTGHGKSVEVFYIFLENEERIFFSGSSDHTIKRWNIHSEYLESQSHKNAVCAMSTSDISSHIVTACSFNQTNKAGIKLWNGTTGELLGSSDASDSSIKSLKFSPDGNLLCWNITKQSFITFWSTDAFVNKMMSFRSAESKSFISSNIMDEKPTFSVKLPADIFGGVIIKKPFVPGLDSMDFSSDGRYLTAISVYGQKAIYVINVKERKCIAQASHKGAVLGGRFSPDGSRLISWSSGYSDPYINRGPGNKRGPDTLSELKLWSFNEETNNLILLMTVSASAEEQMPVFEEESLSGFSTICYASRIIISATYVGHIQVRNADNLDKLKEVYGHSGSVLCVKTTKNGKYLISGSDDKWIKVWLLPTLEQVGAFYIAAAVNCLEILGSNEQKFQICCGDSRGKLSFIKFKKL